LNFDIFGFEKFMIVFSNVRQLLIKLICCLIYN